MGAEREENLLGTKNGHTQTIQAMWSFYSLVSERAMTMKKKVKKKKKLFMEIKFLNSIFNPNAAILT